MTTAEITIIGGGIAGLTAALALQRQGIKVRLFEQAARFAEVGAGLTLSQPATRGLFSLGLRAAIEAKADIPSSVRVADYQTGEEISGPSRAAQAQVQSDIPYFYQIHRADMHAILADAVAANDPDTIALGRRFVALEQHGQEVTAIFEDGSRANSAALIGADGINSGVRSAMFGAENARFTGQVAYRFLIPIADVRRYMQLGPSVHYTGPGRNLVRYLLRGGSLVNGVAFVQTDSWTGEGWSTPASPEELQQQFEGWTSDVTGLLRNAPSDGTRKWALFDREPLEQWTVGRATIMGDAAHPMLPFLGLGAAMGIEDAIVLGRAWCSCDDQIKALQIYQATRLERANAVLLASRRQGEIYQASVGGQRPSPLLSPGQLMNYDPSTVELTNA